MKNHSSLLSKGFIALSFLFVLAKRGGCAAHDCHDDCLDRDDEINSSALLLSETDYVSGAIHVSGSGNLEWYFANLQGNMGKNLKGTCGYVALGMLLSYYDTFKDDTIIPEDYDINNVELAMVSLGSRSESPGVLCEDLNSNYMNGSATAYNNAMYAYRDVSLHAKLLVLGGYAYGTNYSSRSSVLSSYLSSISFSSYSISGLNNESDVTSQATQSVRDSKSTEVWNYVKTQVQNGQPVLVGAANSNFTSHHAFVVYGYDSSSESLLANMGWGYNTNRTKVLLPCLGGLYCYFKSAMVLNVYTTSHSNNYVFRSSFGDQYNYTCCGCGYTTHVHNCQYLYQNSTRFKHKAYCRCSYYILEPHDFLLGTCACGYSDYMMILPAKDKEESNEI